MIKIWTIPSVLFLVSGFLAAELQGIKLNRPDMRRGLPFMETLSVKASATEWSEKELSLQDLSDLLWAANGINRPDQMKSTASSAMNAREVDIYVFMNSGVYLYSPEKHELQPVMEGDFRSKIMRSRPPRPTDKQTLGSKTDTPPPPRPPESNPPLQLILIADSNRFPHGPENLRTEWCAIDTGIVSQNISLFCAATGLKTRPKASMDKEKIKALLKLNEKQYVLLNHPVGYAKSL